MTREEELARMIEDRDIAENDAQTYSDEMDEIEEQYPDSFEERDDWNSLDCAVRDLENEAAYLTSWILSYEQGEYK